MYELLEASRSGCIEKVRQQLADGTIPDCEDEAGRTPLFLAALEGRQDVVDELVNAKAQVNKQSKDGNSPLHIATYNRRKAIILALVQAGANLWIKNQDGDSPLDIAKKVKLQKYVIRCNQDGLAGGPRYAYPGLECYVNRLNPDDDGAASSSGSWGMGPSSRDAIVVRVDKPIILTAVGCYGGDKGTSTYKPLCAVHEGNGSSSMVQLSEGQSEYTDMKHHGVLRVTLKQAVLLKPDTDYCLTQYMKNGSGNCSGWMGRSGKEKQSVVDINFAFADASGSSNGTSTSSGQVPRLWFIPAPLDEAQGKAMAAKATEWLDTQCQTGFQNSALTPDGSVRGPPKHKIKDCFREIELGGDTPIPAPTGGAEAEGSADEEPPPGQGKDIPPNPDSLFAQLQRAKAELEQEKRRREIHAQTIVALKRKEEAALSTRREMQSAGLMLFQSQSEAVARLYAATICAAHAAGSSDASYQDPGTDLSAGIFEALGDFEAASARLLGSDDGHKLLVGLGLKADLLSSMAVKEQKALAYKHNLAVQLRGLSRSYAAGAAAVGNWTREHPVLERDPSGKLKESSVGSADILELLDNGRIRVVDGVRLVAQTLTALQRGRARPLHWNPPDDTTPGAIPQAERLGCNSIVFAIEAVQSEDDGEAKWSEGWRGVLKGLVPIGPQGQYYEPVARQQQYDWLLPAVMGERRHPDGSVYLTGHPNVLAIQHAFLGSSYLLVPWMPWANQRAGTFRRKTTWTVTERFPTTLRGAFRAAWEVGMKVTGRYAALWLVYVLQGLEHARSRGVVHRDVKADNVFLTADGRAVLGDWGAGAMLYVEGLRVHVDRTLIGLVERQIEPERANRSTATTGSAAAASTSGEAESQTFEDDPAAFVRSHLDHKSDALQSKSAALECHTSPPVVGGSATHPLPTVTALFCGCGRGAAPEGVSTEMLRAGGAGSTRAPEVVLGSQSRLHDIRDGWGREVLTAAQVYAWSDAWAAGRMMWELLAEQANASDANLVTLPDSVVKPSQHVDKARGGDAQAQHELQSGVEIPKLPASAGCPSALEAVLRGLLQPKPEHRLPPEEAVQALLGALYGPLTLPGTTADSIAGAPTHIEEGHVSEADTDPARIAEKSSRHEGPGSHSAVRVVRDGGEANWPQWVQQQIVQLSRAEHAMQAVPRAALVGPESEDRGEGDTTGSSQTQAEGGPASGAGADVPPGIDIATAEASTLPASCATDSMMESAVLQAASSLSEKPDKDMSTIGALNRSELVACPKSMSFGTIGTHGFAGGVLDCAIGAGVLQGKAAAEAAVVQAGPMAVLRPPSAGTRAMYGWAVDGVLGRVRPLVEGEASLWDRHLRRELLSGGDAIETVCSCMSSLARTLACFGHRSGPLAKTEGGSGSDAVSSACREWKWSGPRDQRWVPGQVSMHAGHVILPEAQDLPEGWTASLIGPGRVVYEGPNSRVQYDRPTVGARQGSASGDDSGGDPLPAGWEEKVREDGIVVYINISRMEMRTERPTS